MRTYRQVPAPVSGYALDDVWSVLVPVARINVVTNPSFETNTTSWTAIGGSIARSTADQYHGAYSLAITPTVATTDGARYDTVSLASGTTYAYSAKVRGAQGQSYKLAIETTGGAELASVVFVATGRWQWVYGYHTETSTTTRRLTVRKSGGANTFVFYLDGVQVEAIASGETVSTYLDGDQAGLLPNQQPPAYYWNGTPHASTSTRSGLTRAGGMVVKFRDYRFLITAIVGLGLALPQNVATEYARIDGGYDGYTRKPSRQFSLVGTFDAGSYQQLRDTRGGLAALLDRDANGLDQKLVLRHHLETPQGVALTNPTYIPARYAGGLDGNTTNHYGEAAALSFTQYLPTILDDREAGASLSVQQSFTALRLAQRSPADVWSGLSTGSTGTVFALRYASDGKLYVGGQYTTIGGVAANRISYWDGTTFVAMGTGGAGATPAVYTIVEGPDGSIYAGGDVTGFGGVALTAFLAKWNGSAWSSVTPGGAANGYIASLIMAPDGGLIAVGDFTSIGGVAANRIAKWDGTTWAAYAAGLALAPGVTQGVALGLDGTTIFVADGTNGVLKWDGSAWSTIGSVTLQSVNRVAIGPDGSLYAGGDFTSIGGVAATRIAKWNGVAWTPLGAGVTNAGAGDVTLILPQPDGTVIVGGNFTTAGGITTIRNIARWNGSAWVYFDMNVGWSQVFAGAQKRDGSLAFGGSGGTSAATATALTTITNTGTARSYPTVTIKGPASGASRIYQIANPTTGRSIYLDYTINAGETAIFRFQPDNLSFTSDFQGNIADTILAGSNESDFFLAPGANTISFFAADSSVTATIAWRPGYASLDDTL